ncbi:MAG: tetrahydrofolate dehydrogenase/cyclohydrolase catalytic domain-containing protein, partial [Gemmatimonadales bacterium]
MKTATTSNVGRIIDGNAIGAEMRAELAGEIAALKKKALTPGLAVVLVGDNPASQVYVRMKGKACEEAGLYHETIKLPKETSEADLMGLLERLNANPKIHGILVQLPLPKQIDTNRALHRIDPRKDVDGFHPENVGKVAVGDPSGFRPATPYGVQQL